MRKSNGYGAVPNDFGATQSFSALPAFQKVNDTSLPDKEEASIEPSLRPRYLRR